MNLYLLIDLDDTLLSNQMRAFQPAYLKALSTALAHQFDPRTLVQELMESTQRMIENDRPDRTLEEVFDANFYPSLGVTRPSIQDEIDRFYAEDFPALKSLTTPIPEAHRLIETAIGNGWQMIVATNPLFPLTAIHQRLAWAGFPPDKVPFQLVTSYESFHFSKPSPAFYAECLAQAGYLSGPVIMVGNDFADDIRPAARLGLATFWVHSKEMAIPATDTLPTHSGTLSELVQWLGRIEPERLEPKFQTPLSFQTCLKATAAGMDGFTRSLPPSAWNVRKRPSEWCPTEILCHLRDVDREVNLPRLRLILKEKNPFLPGVITDEWAEERGYIRQDGPQALADFISARLELLDILTDLTDEDWERASRHAIFGPTPLKDLVEFMKAHDRAHLQQMKACL